MEETTWRQKSGEIWLKDWDKKTPLFFHKMANVSAFNIFSFYCLSKKKITICLSAQRLNFTKAKERYQ